VADGVSDVLVAAERRLAAETGVARRRDLGVLAVRDLERFALVAGAPALLEEQAPPLYLSSVMGWSPGPPEPELRPDGSGTDETRGLPLEGLRLMGAGQELEFHRPARAGDRVVETTTLLGVRRKSGRTGDLLLLQVRREFADGARRPLVTCDETFVAR
jgi:hydroxyacyl-ACP dehydratase HTD2-like protein with hotdog domain